MTPEASAAASALNIIERLFIELVEYPQHFHFRTRQSQAGLTFVVRSFWLADHKRLIGVRGGNYGAMKLLVEKIGEDLGERWMLPMLMEPPNEQEQVTAPDKPKNAFQSRIKRLAEDLLEALPCEWDSVQLGPLGAPGDEGFDLTLRIGQASINHRDLWRAVCKIFLAIGRRWDVDLRVNVEAVQPASKL